MKRVIPIVTLMACCALGDSAAAAAQRLAPNMQPMVIGTVAEWFGDDNYPPEAIRLGRQGRVVAEIGVDSGGRAASCRVAESSGTTALDNKVCEIALAHMTFNPATDKRGRPVSGIYRLPVKWQLPENIEEIDVSAGAPPDLAMETEIKVSADGQIMSCKVLTQTARQGPVDPCASTKPGMDIHRRWVKRGQPVPMTFVQRYYIHTQIDE